MRKTKIDDVIEMEQDEHGTFRPIVPYRRPQKVEVHIHRNEVRAPSFYQFIDGFIVGLEAIERFLRYVKTFRR